MAFGEGHGEAAQRAADAMLRSLGGTRVIVRTKAPAGTDDASQMGLVAPDFQDVVLEPVVVRPVSAGVQMMISARSVETATGAKDASLGRALFAECFGIVVDGVVMRVLSCVTNELFGAVYLYRITAGAVNGG